MKSPDLEPLDWRLLIVVGIFHLRQGCEQSSPRWPPPLHCSQAILNLFYNILLFFQLSHLFRSKHSQGEENSWVNCSPPLGTSLSFNGYQFPKASKHFSPVILKTALKLFHQLKNFFKYSLFSLDLNGSWPSPGTLLTRQPSEVGHAHSLCAANLHPGPASRLRSPVSSFGTCTSFSLPLPVSLQLGLHHFLLSHDFNLFLFLLLCLISHYHPVASSSTVL